ncbi:hypothetical protein SAMN05421544_10362 [Riemerella columbipharyngis]|uniref:Uncharacterized protein n=1 Tax=Riemerella columbipharyngis TaxID=1071918 RepID=A0A1G7A8M2_9FLAO|nr:hypothetical protein SAMN05421544_10362 [Riemerella columbipharyngis]
MAFLPERQNINTKNFGKGYPHNKMGKDQPKKSY